MSVKGFGESIPDPYLYFDIHPLFGYLSYKRRDQSDLSFT